MDVLIYCFAKFTFRITENQENIKSRDFGAGDLAQLVKHFPSVHEGLSSIPSTV